METTRFFVSNLPHNIQENDLQQLFQDYGEIVKIEIKTKENLVDPEAAKIIAFVTLKIGQEDAKYCAGDLCWQKINGCKITVNIAKESFLERLKREREEAAASTSSENQKQLKENRSELLLGNHENKKKVFADDDSDDNGDDLEPSLMITKKRAASSIQNGKIVIQSFDSKPLHVIESKKQKKNLDEKAASSEQKRKESMKKLKNQYDEQKNAIQKALAGTNGSLSNKIKFSDDEDEEKPAKSENKLFDSSDGSDEETLDFKVRPEMLGKKGEKLLEMQSKQSLDPRFKIDAKFVDDEVGDSDEDEKALEEPKEDNERDWQMGILEDVIGQKIDKGPETKKKNQKKMVRYDPAKEEDKKFERKKKTKQKKNDIPDFSKDPAESEYMEVKNEPAEVSKEVFYVVEDTLAESLKKPTEGFSLLTLFGDRAGFDEREDRMKQVSNAKIFLNKFDPKVMDPFKYETGSESEAESEEETPKSKDKILYGKPSKPLQVSMEPFFFVKNDQRLKDGAKFFTFTKDPEKEENYDKIRDQLKTLIKTKIAKAKKNIQTEGKRIKRNKAF